MTAIAIDDEPLALEVIKSHASKVPFLELKELFTNAFEAAAYLQKEEVDLLFLDIKMPDITGMEFLRTLPQPPMTVFTTAYSEHALQSFELDAVDYLLKPFSVSRFFKACNKAHELYLLRRPFPRMDVVFLKSGYETIRVDLANLLYIESAGNYLNFITAEDRIMVRMAMAEALALLPSGRFIRIHRSFIVAVDKIDKTDLHQISIGSVQLPVGASFVNNLESTLHDTGS